jgi:hypothetical protein
MGFAKGAQADVEIASETIKKKQDVRIAHQSSGLFGFQNRFAATEAK